MAAAGLNLFSQRDNIRLVDIRSRPKPQVAWERWRNRQVHWFSECAAEFVGTFFWVFAGVGSAATFRLNTADTDGLSSVLQIGIAYAIGVVLAFVVTAQTSGGHYNPAVSIIFALRRRMSPQKALRYVVAQILGSYVACLLVYAQYRDIIKQSEAALAAAGTLDSVLFTPNGPAGAFAMYDFLIGLVIWAVDDPTNYTVSPVAAPWIIAFVYALMVWSFSRVGVATNSARDVGARLMVLTVWGLDAGGGAYAAITALTNIPATLLAAVFYELVLADYGRVLTPAHADVLAAGVAYDSHRQSSTAELSPGASREKTLEETVEKV